MVKVIAVFLDTLASLLGSGSHVPRRNPVFPTLCVESGNAERCRQCVPTRSVGTRAFALLCPITLCPITMLKCPKRTGFLTAGLQSSSICSFLSVLFAFFCGRLHSLPSSSSTAAPMSEAAMSVSPTSIAWTPAASSR